ncbi:bifunctional transcriptional activator/DNA repair enzyme AdaA [Streptomyces broussonetiae]|uniref:Helix-turn-helix domain-containing protein n=1 Tax=Streptomyces broussonetiae TaxID=2686304 RepID=A0A6I6NBD5_9ACTN|nr:AlkA N-terminal domain-containing protein [Streptomyces broussonetiae]QHA08782.1 helix-turn-helix domain-containing protein [Streptomyces broussonetiae]
MTTYSAVVTTGIYCRPGCGARPLAENVRTFELPAAAEANGFRACLRCRPYRVAGPIAADVPELLCRAVQLIIAGALDADTEAALGARLALSPRHLRRLFTQHLGVTPDQLARSRRAHFARRLLDDTDLTVADVAFASGFGSVRQFNRDMRLVFLASPLELRSRRRRTDRLVADGGLEMRLPFAPPLHWPGLLALLAERAVPGVESVAQGVYRRTISLDGEAGLLEVRAGGADHLLLRAHLPFWEGLIHVVERIGRIFGVDADVAPAETALAADPVIGPLIAARPGLRVPGAWGAFEIAADAVLRQYAAGPRVRQQMAALAEVAGQPVPGIGHGLTRLFPSAETVAVTDLEGVGLSAQPARALRALALAVAADDTLLDGGSALADLVPALGAVPGVTEDTAQRIALRLGHGDAFPAATTAAHADAAVAAWRPWRAFAATHLAVAELSAVTA